MCPASPGGATSYAHKTPRAAITSGP